MTELRKRNLTINIMNKNTNIVLAATSGGFFGEKEYLVLQPEISKKYVE
jgi:hypothetical protein